MNKEELKQVNEIKDLILNPKRRYCCYLCSVDGFCPTYDCGSLDKIKAYTDRQWLNTIKNIQKTYKIKLSFEDLVLEVFYDITAKRPRNKK